MKTYHKPKIELKQFGFSDVLSLSGEIPFHDGWFTEATEVDS